MKATAAGLSLLPLLLAPGIAADANAQAGTGQMVEFAGKYAGICQTASLDNVMPELVADGLNKPPRGQAPTKTIGDWTVWIELPASGMFAAQQAQQGGITKPFACRISASFKTDAEPDISPLQSDFVPMLSRHFGQPAISEAHMAQWCETADGGVRVSAASRPASGGMRGGRSTSAELVNTFSIHMSIASEKGSCRPR